MNFFNKILNPRKHEENKGEGGEGQREGLEEEESPSIEFTTLVESKETTSPKIGQKVEIQYKGILKATGEPFDLDHSETSLFYELGSPDQIQCWNEAIPMLGRGQLIKLICPAELAYGKDGRPPLVPPDSELIYYMKLMDFKDQE